MTDKEREQLEALLKLETIEVIVDYVDGLIDEATSAACQGAYEVGLEDGREQGWSDHEEYLREVMA